MKAKEGEAGHPKKKGVIRNCQKARMRLARGLDKNGLQESGDWRVRHEVYELRSEWIGGEKVETTCADMFSKDLAIERTREGDSG